MRYQGDPEAGSYVLPRKIRIIRVRCSAAPGYCLVSRSRCGGRAHPGTTIISGPPFLRVRFPYFQLVIHIHETREPYFALREASPCPMIIQTAAGPSPHRIIISERRWVTPAGAGSSSAHGARPERYCRQGRRRAGGHRPGGSSGRQAPCRESAAHAASRPVARPRPGPGPRCRPRRSRRRTRRA